MRLPPIVLVVLIGALVLLTSTSVALAGAQDTGELASCEIASAKGIPIFGTTGVSIDLSSQLAVASFQTLALKPRPQVVVLRVLVGLDIGVSPMENVCQILNGETAEGGATLAEQILAAVGLTGKQIAITKRGIFGCDVLPCANPGLKPDFALVPGSADIGFPTATALGTVVLYAVK
jgi:hypothetical protein